MTRPRLIVFAKYPRAGEVKTRLIPAIGAEVAAGIARTLFGRTVSEGVRAAALLGMDLEVRGAGASEVAFRALHPGPWSFAGQGDGDLGERLARSCADAAASGAPAVLLVGTDCPDLDASVCAAALAALETRSVALAPAADGGYVLLGLRPGEIPEFEDLLFRGIPWSTERVARETLRRLADAHVPTAVLPAFADVDRPEDLTDLHDATPLISVVIPALNEAAAVADAVRSAALGFHTEVIVADGGGADDTRERAAEAGARVVRCAPGRGRQLNAGASAASGEILLFLHADTKLPPGWAARIRRALTTPGVAGGAFRLSFGDASPQLSRVARWANIRAERTGILYGDQGIFVRSSAFRDLGGFPAEPLMEDLAFVRALRRTGKFTVLPDAVETSGRRYERNGVLKTCLLHQILLAAWLLGVPAETLARWRKRLSRRGVNTPI